MQPQAARRARRQVRLSARNALGLHQGRGCGEGEGGKSSGKELKGR